MFAYAGNSTMLGGLGLLNSANALSSNSFDDHKTLVMVFLKGGVDSLGLLIPSDPQSYSQYRGLRQHLATPEKNLIEFNSLTLASPDYCAEMLDLFNTKKLSWVSNVGPLRQPTTKTMIQND